MKNQTLLLLASLAVLTTGASAAQNQPETDLVVLPIYIVQAPRHLPIEKRINASLDELRQQTHVPFVIAPEFSALKAQANRTPGLAADAQSLKSTRVAKL